MSVEVKSYQLNKFDPTENSNKVWIGKAFDDGKFEVKFGRVRDSGAGMMGKIKQFSSSMAAISELEKKYSEKVKKGYRETSVVGNVETQIFSSSTKPQELSKIAVEQITGTTDKTTAELIKYLAEVNIHNITHATNIKYDAANATFKTPLGVLTPNAVAEARGLLTQISKLNKIQSANSIINSRNEKIRDYFQLVPKDFGVKIPPASELLADKKAIGEQSAILDALDSAITLQSPQMEADKMFRCKLTKVPHWTEEGKKAFREVKSLFEKSRNSSHQTSGLKLVRLYEIEIENMKTDFDKISAKIGNVETNLWHGTKASNLLSILKSGLQIPKSSDSHCTGRMFGDGIYTSNQSTKALNYATDYWNKSGNRNQRTFMFLTEVALGKTNKPKTKNGSFPKAGTNSTWVEAGNCGVMNHECIVYETAQINLKYLCEFGAE